MRLRHAWVSELRLVRRAPAAGAPPTIEIEPARRLWALHLREIWSYKELIYFLIWRDIKVRYKQTVIGVAWVIVQPVMMMVVFTLVFQYIADVPSDGLPYPIFTYTALLPWNFFTGALGRSSLSLTQQANLISKVYFPRLITPLAATASGFLDFGIAFVILVGLMLWYGITLTWAALTLPAFLVFALTTALSLGLWLSALNVKYRDVGHAVPFLLQVWMYASPVVYPVSEVPERWRLLYGLNPMTGVIEGFRWALLGKESPDFHVIAVSAIGVVAILIGGLIYFKRVEQTFADVV
jgi:lipopolysaccharide transport system permease protein